MIKVMFQSANRQVNKLNANQQGRYKAVIFETNRTQAQAKAREQKINVVVEFHKLFKLHIDGKFIYLG